MDVSISLISSVSGGFFLSCTFYFYDRIISKFLSVFTPVKENMVNLIEAIEAKICNIVILNFENVQIYDVQCA